MSIEVHGMKMTATVPRWELINEKTGLVLMRAGHYEQHASVEPLIARMERMPNVPYILRGITEYRRIAE